MKRKLSVLFVGLLALSVTACGKTQVKLTNSTGQTLNTVYVSNVGSGSSNTIVFSNIASGVTTDAADWSDDNNLIARVDVQDPSLNETTDSVSLDAGKTNVLTLTLSGGQVVYTRSTE